MTPLVGTLNKSQQLDVAHACGHTLRWHFLLPDERAILAAGLAAVLNCPRCDGTTPAGGACVSYYPTGICHAHDGACPNSQWDEWLEALGCRFRADGLVIL